MGNSFVETVEAELKASARSRSKRLKKRMIFFAKPHTLADHALPRCKNATKTPDEFETGRRPGV
jgi:hypothetical protein